MFEGTLIELPNFFGWLDYHISLAMGLRPRARFARGWSSSIKLKRQLCAVESCRLYLKLSSFCSRYICFLKFSAHYVPKSTTHKRAETTLCRSIIRILKVYLISLLEVSAFKTALHHILPKFLCLCFKDTKNFSAL